MISFVASEPAASPEPWFRGRRGAPVCGGTTVVVAGAVS